MIDDPGPYMEMDGPGIWVPRTVPYLEARRIAHTGIQNYGDRLRYVGKDDSELVGFARSCLCDERCCGGPVDEDGSCTSLPECRVPTWHFEAVER